MEKKHILIICGEPSGDLNAASLVNAIRQKRPDIRFSGVGGTLLRQAGVSLFADIKDIAVFGLFDALKKLPSFFALKKMILQEIKTKKPDAIILVDFSGFNLRLAKAINRSIPVIYYVSPQVWASRPGRIKTIQRYVSKMIVLFKFEQEFYKQRGILVDFVGHPLLDIVAPTASRKELFLQYGLAESNTTIALLPGSRRQEIDNVLPVMLQSAIKIKAQLPQCQFIIAKSPHVALERYQRFINMHAVKATIIENRAYDCIAAADFCLVCSGTATLETAILQKPFCVVYKMNPLNYALYRPQVKIEFIGMANIIAGRKIVPEFIQYNATARRISTEVVRTLQNLSLLQQMKNDLASVRSRLGERGACSRAADLIIDYLAEK